MLLDEFDYILPPHLIAQLPRKRGDARLLALNRADGNVIHSSFSKLDSFLQPDDLLVLNDTRVSARRLKALREDGQEAELLLLHPAGENQWEALVRPGLKPGRKLRLLKENGDEAGIIVQISAITADGGRLLEFPDRITRDSAYCLGIVPLPPYIRSPLPGDQEERYQTVYASKAGSAAAPTAGLHFTREHITQLREDGISFTNITLHIGIDTFRPVRTEVIENHEMHGEIVEINKEAADAVNSASGRIIAAGTTVVRALETAAVTARNSGSREKVVPFTGETRLFLKPGSNFGAVDALITNFHLPRSTLLILVSALAGRDKIMSAYAEAIRNEYQFYSFGDAMLIY